MRRTPRLELILFLTAELVLSFMAVYSLVYCLESFLTKYLLFGFLDPLVDRLIIYFVSMIGATGVLYAGVQITLADHKDKGKSN